MTTPEEDPIETEDKAPEEGAPTAAGTGIAPTRAAAPTDDVPEGEEKHASAEVMALLGEHVPLALLADLAQPEGPLSPKILEDEGLPEDPWWEQ